MTVISTGKTSFCTHGNWPFLKICINVLCGMCFNNQKSPYILERRKYLFVQGGGRGNSRQIIFMGSKQVVCCLICFQDAESKNNIIKTIQSIVSEKLTSVPPPPHKKVLQPPQSLGILLIVEIYATQNINTMFQERTNFLCLLLVLWEKCYLY